jgi:4-hydroxybenzoate polyprenyltransferase
MYLPGLACFATCFSQTPFPDLFSCQLALLCTTACGLLYMGYYPGPWNPLPISFSRLLVLKNVTIALAWTLASLLVVTPLPPLGWVLHRFLFVFGLSLAADLRDTKRDQVMGIETVASQLGYNKTKWLAAVMVFAAGFALLTLEQNSRPGLLWTRTASFSCGTILLCLRQDIPEQRFGPLIDGMMAITAVGTMLSTLN